MFYLLYLLLGPSLFADLIMVEQASAALFCNPTLIPSVAPTLSPPLDPGDVVIPRCRPTAKQRHANEVMIEFEQQHRSLLDLHDK